MTRPPSKDAKLGCHLARTRLVTRTALNCALDIVFAQIALSRPIFSSAEDDYDVVDQEHKIMKKTLLAEITRRFGKQRGRPASPIGYFTEAFIWSEMARLTANGMGGKKAAEAVGKKLAAERLKLFATWRKRFPGKEPPKLPRLITAQAIEMRWRRRSSD